MKKGAALGVNMKPLLALLAILCLSGAGVSEPAVRTLYGNLDPVDKPHGQRTVIINSDNVQGASEGHRVEKRDVSTDFKSDTNLKITFLNDTHKQLMVHWVGEGSNVIICLARDPKPTVLPGLQPVGPSSVYISYDYGDTYVNKTDLFKTANGTIATLDKFYNHPKYNTHLVFTDVENRAIYTTRNYGKDIQRIQLDFTPTDISFHEFIPSLFVALDKEDSAQKLYLTEDFGKSFKNIQSYVKSFSWITDNDKRVRFMVQRMEPSGLSSILHSPVYFQDRVTTIYATGVRDLFIKGDYLFTTKPSMQGLQLYVSQKLGKQLKCVFDVDLEQKGYLIVDVTSNRALVAVSHSETSCNLYVSENLNTDNKEVRFTLSLENLLCYFPNTTWHESVLHHVAEEAFADVYKVEGLTGIYIASRLLVMPVGNNLGPQHLASVITFDHGRFWQPVKAPERDVEGQPISCSINNNCSLHLSQKFSQLHPDTRSINILSSKSAPGVIMATGVLGKSLKGHYGVYISTDAGQTWRQTLRELYFFNMGDHGGILVAVTYFKSRGETRHVLYSTDEGETWKQTSFHNKEIRLYGLMTEPGENTTVFTMFGSLTQEHQWMIVKLDLIKAFQYNCTKDDYKTWSPSQSKENPLETRNYIPCILGQELTYKRRMPHANCYNGLNFDSPMSMKSCECDIYDYECDFGFVRAEQAGNCIRNTSLDPYKIPVSCKPGAFYNRTKGYRKIQGDVCIDGFKSHYEPEEVPCPFNEIPDFLLFAQRERITRFNLVTHNLEEMPIKNLKNVIAIDFDIKNNCVYWADIASDTIGRQCLGKQNEPEILVSSDLASIEGMALDWISHTLYFVDGMRSKIELIRTDINHSGRMRRTILGPSDLKKPRGIALHPKAGYMFWTDWSSDNPSVNRAHLDGSNVKKLFGSPDVEWPNGVTVDYIAERIYWVDARQDYIASSGLDGPPLKKIISKEDVVSHPFAVAVFKNSMYWDDWKRNAIFSADKDSFKGVEVLQKQLPGLMDLKVYAHGIQIGANECSTTNRCDYLCVGAPKGGSTCLCPDGMDFTNNTCMCPGGVKPYANYTCPKIQNTCSSDHFSCANGLCIPKGWRCDGETDCGDNSDEDQCGTHTCPSNYFVCGNGKCLPQYWKCDYDPDCADESDELDCPKQECKVGQFSCKNGRCIAAKWRCDGENDCKDNSDEKNCEPAEPLQCKDDEFHCKSGGLACIPMTWRCDGELDCRDNSDEADCKNNTCSDMQFSCGPPLNRCIYSTWVCDGDRDCPDGGDEKNCPSTSIPTVQHNITEQFISRNGSCHDWMFKCLNQKCIPFWWKCDNADDCGDGSDEVGCNKTPNGTFVKPAAPTTLTPKICGNGQYQCASGACILQAWVCDGMIDCPDGDDELQCESMRKCNKDQFQCRKSRSCVSVRAVCDGYADCPDSSDEAMCEKDVNIYTPATPSCSIGYYPCDEASCHPLATLCDGKPDCKNGYDEANCSPNTTRIYQVLQMGVDERGVNLNTTLFLYWWIPNPNNATLEFLPSISKADSGVWENKTWTNNTEYAFNNLAPYTRYNMTIYVRIKSSKVIFPPAKYFIASTSEGVPTPPWHLTATQRNGSDVLISWNKPVHPNGLITNYKICWTPPQPPIKLKLSGNETAHLLPPYFESNITYKFYVIAYNRKYESEPSEIATLLFDADSNLRPVTDLKVEDSNSSSVSLSWKYKDPVDGFQVSISTDSSYPKIPPKTTNTTSLVIGKLAPGIRYTFKVKAVRKTFSGPETSVSEFTTSTPLPEIDSLQASLIKEVGTSVKLKWSPPNYIPGNVEWVYGVYYGINQEELLEKPRKQLKNLSTIVENLLACEIYTFSIGVTGPYGIGPLSKTLVEITTDANDKAPPKNVTVTAEESDPLKIRLEWMPSCPAIRNSSFIIRIHERTRDRLTYIRNNYVNGQFFHLFNITYGASYEFSVATVNTDAIYSQAKRHDAPTILPPYEVKTFVESNGSYVVYWQERELSKEVGSYTYEVLISEGPQLNESTALRFQIDKPPFIYTNFTASMYTFAVQIKTNNGYRSGMSESWSVKSSVPISSTGLSLILIITAVVITAMVALLIGLILRHRRLQNSFSRFANSHYDSRSGAATFDDHGLEEEDCPQITRFSDDEPLVIA